MPFTASWVVKDAHRVRETRLAGQQGEIPSLPLDTALPFASRVIDEANPAVHEEREAMVDLCPVRANHDTMLIVVHIRSVLSETLPFIR